MARRSLLERLFARPPQPEQRAAWDRWTGDMSIAGAEGIHYIGYDTWPAVLHGPGQSAPERLPVTTRATNLIVGPLTAAPYQLQDALTGEQFPIPRWLADPMLLRPDARLVDGLAAFPHTKRLTRSGFFREVIRSCIWYGIGAFVYSPSSTGEPIAGTMRQVHPGALSINTDGNWRLGVGTETGDFNREGSTFIGETEYRICVMRNPLSPVLEDGTVLGVFGLSPSAFEIASSIDSYTAGTFRSGVPAGYLRANTPGLNQPQADELKSKWLAAHGGDRRSIAVLNATTEFHPISYSPVDAEAVAIKRMAIGDVAMAFGLPPEVLGVSLSNSSTYVNVGDTWDRLRAFGLSPWIAEVEDALSALAPLSQIVQVDISAFQKDPTPPAVPAGPQSPAVPNPTLTAVPDQTGAA
jgi:Phage portal protein